MKLLLLANSNSIHTKRWTISLAQKGIEICLFSLEKNRGTEYINLPNVKLIYGEIKNITKKNGEISKVALLKYLPKIKSIIKEFNPDLVHAHYATSYGLLGSLCGFHPFVLSVWGSDIYLFPNVSILHKALLKYNLSKADYVLSTSHIMARETSRYTPKKIEITPFGIDPELFKKDTSNENIDDFIVGTIKELAPIYGIDILIRSFHLVIQNNPGKKLKLQIIGDGPDRENLQKLTYELRIQESVDFIGKIENCLLPKYYNNFSVAAFLSITESFGVVAIESMACECPVIVSDADGFTEVVKDNESGFIVPKRNIEATAMAIQKFIDDPSLREKMGRKGRERAVNLYDWSKNVDHMVNIYKNITSF